MAPAQVGARILEFSMRRWSNPLNSAKIANALHPFGAAVATFGGAAVIAPFSIIHGAGNGILTIARGTLPLAIFGPEGCGDDVIDPVVDAIHSDGRHGPEFRTQHSEGEGHELAPWSWVNAVAAPARNCRRPPNLDTAANGRSASSSMRRS